MNDLTELPTRKKRGRKPKNNIDIIDKELKIKKKPGRKPKNKNIEDNQPKLKKTPGRKSKNREENPNIENFFDLEYYIYFMDLCRKLILH